MAAIGCHRIEFNGALVTLLKMSLDDTGVLRSSNKHNSACFMRAAEATDTQTFNSIYASWNSPSTLFTWGGSFGYNDCNMTGVQCDSTSRVVSVAPSGPSIKKCPFPHQLSSLSSLTSISLYQVQLSVTVAPQISALGSLQSLQLSCNPLSGSVPAAISVSAPSLTDPELNNSQPAGSAQSQLGVLSGLRFQLQPGHNTMNGQRSTSVSQLVSVVDC